MSFLTKTAGTAFTQVTLMGLNLLGGVILARWLGPDDRGRYALLILIPQLLFVIANLGVGASTTYFTSGGKHPARDLLGLTLLLSALLGTAAGLLFLAGLPLYRGFWSSSPTALVFALTLLTPFYFARNYLARFLAGLQQIARMNGVNLTQAVAMVLAALVLVVGLEGGLVGAVAGFSLSILSALLLGLVWSLRGAGGNLGLGLSALRPVIRYGLQAHLLVVANFLNYRFDLFLVKYYLDDAQVGHYSVVVGLAERLWILPNALAVVLFPTVASMESADAHRLAARSARSSLAPLLLAGLALAFAGRPLIWLLYGDEYLPAFPALLALLPGIALFPLFKILAVHAAGRGRPILGAVPSFLVLVLNIAANLVLIPRWGIVGASAASSLSYGLAGIGCVLVFARHARIPLRRILVPAREDLVALRRLLPRR